MGQPVSFRGSKASDIKELPNKKDRNSSSPALVNIAGPSHGHETLELCSKARMLPRDRAPPLWSPPPLRTRALCCSLLSSSPAWTSHLHLYCMLGQEETHVPLLFLLRSPPACQVGWETWEEVVRAIGKHHRPPDNASTLPALGLRLLVCKVSEWI